MKKYLMILVTLLILCSINQIEAQNFGVRAGLNLASITIYDDHGQTYNDLVKSRTGFHIGFNYLTSISPIFDFEIGLLLSNKGYKIDFQTSEDDQLINHSSYYFELPINLRAGIDVNNARLFAFAGPYIAYGFAGSITNTYIDDMGIKVTESVKIKWGSGEDDQSRPLDFGINVGAGVAFKSFQFLINYGIGLIDTFPIEESDINFKNRVVGISIGYIFGNKEIE